MLPMLSRSVQAVWGAGGDVWSSTYDEVVKAMLSEAELHQHELAHALVWVQAMTPLLQVRMPLPPRPATPPPFPAPSHFIQASRECLLRWCESKP